jgi:hypothetical protein
MLALVAGGVSVHRAGDRSEAFDTDNGSRGEEGRSGLLVKVRIPTVRPESQGTADLHPQCTNPEIGNLLPCASSLQYGVGID